MTQSSERTGIENNWFALTGRVVDVKVEMDGDLHLALQDATGDKAGIVVCEIPAKQHWCSIRETVFSWTTTRFPFHTSSDRKLKLIGAPIITVTGKAYWDVGPCAQGSIKKPEKPSSRVRCMGNSPGDAAGRSVKNLLDVLHGPTRPKRINPSFRHTDKEFRSNRKLVKTIKPLKFHHSVYVVLLDNAVAKHPSILRANPKRDPLKPCVYVGMTGLSVDHRFKNHKNGYKSAWVESFLIAGRQMIRPACRGRPMKLKFECPTCGQHLSGTPAQIGVTAQCLNCNTWVTVPNTSTLPPSHPPLPQPQSPPPPRKQHLHDWPL